MNDSGKNGCRAVYFEKDGLKYLQFSNLKKYEGLVTHCFTTRLGGVSTGECGTLNLGFNRKDSRDNVLENFNRVCSAINIDSGNLVFSSQVHDNKIRVVDENDRGKGIIRASDIFGFDGLVTDRKSVALVTFYADCVPIFLFDPEKRVIALAHSGWKGTVKQIGREAVEKMTEVYGCSSEKIEAAVGPSIGQCCFEVDNDVYREFAQKIPWSSAYCKKTNGTKWNISLQEIIRHTLEAAGVRHENICLSNICTKCNRDIYFSHRGDHGKTGSLAAFMQLL